jgi:hypothetical protein
LPSFAASVRAFTYSLLPSTFFSEEVNNSFCDLMESFNAFSASFNSSLNFLAYLAKFSK